MASQAKELPWPQEQLAKMRAAAQLVTPELEGAEKARTIGDATPFTSTERLSVTRSTSPRPISPGFFASLSPPPRLLHKPGS